MSFLLKFEQDKIKEEMMATSRPGKKGDCGGTPRVGKKGDAKPVRGNRSPRRGQGQRQR